MSGGRGTGAVSFFLNSSCDAEQVVVVSTIPAPRHPVPLKSPGEKNRGGDVHPGMSLRCGLRPAD